MKDQESPRDIRARTFRLALDVVRLCKSLEGAPWIRRTLGRQLIRSGTSVGANMEEAQAAQSHADFIHKCQIALKEARETVYWLRLLMESGECSLESAKPLKDEALEVAKIIGAIVVSAKKKKV